MTNTPWPAGTATAIGSMPGTDAMEAVRIVLGELPDLPHLPELPDRGVGADLLGRTAALLVAMPVEVVPSGYRLAARSGLDQRRAQDLMRMDLDALDAVLQETGVRPERLKVQLAGPWTFAASVELPRGHRLLTDAGALRDLVESQMEGLTAHVRELTERTGAQIVVQIDEPSLPAVIDGRLPTPSGLDRVPAVPAPEAQNVLAGVVAAAEKATGAPVLVHCCAPDAPSTLLRGAGAGAVGVDLTLPLTESTTALDAIGELWDSGATLLLGLLPGTDPTRPPTLRAAARPAFELVDRLGFPRALLATKAVPTPACGFAGASPEWTRTAMTTLRELGRVFLEPPEDW
ncbi:methionine synthase II (cobalamin-independent) [Actinoalloteichus hoggarensis]|uniref:methionine synthase n=1 Tax=Actinoalloteichus hoggarensis TaxID=1470176 RepID=UPI000B8AE056|nr:methionine synthase [Actinoalloteichus hoggarensis]MBB5923175.1 methionine synthase II (cobalamin-independent) [Actinoalloteichus hoggarensis]